MTKKRVLSAFIFLFLSLLWSEATNIQGLYRYKLENGLELFVAENDSAPLTYIEIAVRAGAVTQTPENAGLFHLYEHMLFKGNAKYSDQDAFTEAANKMGRIGENGTTSVDRVNYFFTLPSSQVRKGLEFWSYAVRTPKLDEKELEREKAVVLSEINADFSDPARIRFSAMAKELFPKSPWRLSPSGDPKVVKNATASDLIKMQKEYYIPANSAIFVGGDVNHEKIFKYVKEIYSDWKNPSEFVKFESPESKTPLLSDKKMVFVNKGNSDSMIQVIYALRGPDGETDASDTYSADVWLNFMNSPDSVFSEIFVSEKDLGIPENNYIGVSYPTRRASGTILFYGTMLTKSQKLNPLEKSEKFYSLLKGKALDTLLDKKQFFRTRSVDFVKQILEDDRIYSLETAKGLIDSLSYFWSACDSDYFFSYDQNLSKVSEDDVISFVKKYIQNKHGVFVVSVSPGIWQKYKGQFLSSGYEEITSENAFWQKKLDGGEK